MAARRNQNQPQTFKIYVLVSSDQKEIYVGKTAAATPKVAYKYHAAMKHPLTCDLFLNSRETQNFPTMYLLEELSATPQIAFGHCVVWVKYFLKHGLKPLIAQTVLDYTEELTEENEKVFDSIKDLPIEVVFATDRLLISEYKVQKKQQVEKKKEAKNESIIALHLTPDNYELLSEKASEARMSMSKYCQIMAINGQISEINVYEYLAELEAVEFVLERILDEIYLKKMCSSASFLELRRMFLTVIDGEKAVEVACEKQAESVNEYKKLMLQNYRLKSKIKELEKSISELKKKNTGA